LISRKQGFDVIYVDPLHRQFLAYTDIGEVVARVSEVVADIAGYSSAKLAELVVYLVNELRRGGGEEKLLCWLMAFSRLLGLRRQKPMSSHC